MRLWITLKVPFTENDREIQDRIAKELLDHPLVEDIGVTNEKNSRLGKAYLTLMGVFDGDSAEQCLDLAQVVYREALDDIEYTEYDMEWTYRLLHDKVDP